MLILAKHVNICDRVIMLEAANISEKISLHKVTNFLYEVNRI